MKTLSTAPSIEEQKAIILDCLDKITAIGRVMEEFFPRITRSHSDLFSRAEKSAYDIHENHIGNVSNDLSDIYACLIEKEVCHG